MVHLAIAVQMHVPTGSIPTPAFLLGSIAPDAIHMRSNTGRGDKQRVHLLATPDSAGHKRVHALVARYWAEESGRADFAEGYAAHLLADRLWVQTVLTSFRGSIPPGLSFEEQRSLYYRETDQVDFDLYHQMPWRSEVWAKLAAASPEDFASLLTAEEIRQWRDRTLHWYGGLKEEPGIEPTYITGEDVQGFIGQAAEMIVKCFTAWKSSTASAGRHTGVCGCLV